MKFSRARLAVNRRLGLLLGPICRRGIYPLRFKSLPELPEPIWIKPEMVSGWFPGSRFKSISFPGKIESGDWYKNVRPRDVVLSSSQKVNSTIEHFSQGVPWIETQLFRDRYAKDLPSPKLHALANQYSKYDLMFEEVKNHGFTPATKKNSIEPMFVHLGPEGQIYWTADGNHRFAMALVLNIFIPVTVLTRHLAWQKFRDKYFMNKCQLPEGLHNHPDLKRSQNK